MKQRLTETDESGHEYWLTRAQSQAYECLERSRQLRLSRADRHRLKPTLVCVGNNIIVSELGRLNKVRWI